MCQCLSQTRADAGPHGGVREQGLGGLINELLGKGRKWISKNLSWKQERMELPRVRAFPVKHDAVCLLRGHIQQFDGRDG